jgi:hypothetical protein
MELLSILRNCSLIISLLCGLYSIIFNIIRCCVYEDNGFQDTLYDILMNSILFPTCILCTYYEDKSVRFTITIYVMYISKLL